MNSAMSPRSKVPKSRIPVLVKSQKVSNVNGFKKKELEKTVGKAPVAGSTKFTKSSHNLQKQSSSQLVKSVKAQNDKCIRSVKSDPYGQSSLKNNKISNNHTKTDNKSSQLKKSVKPENNKEKCINKPDNSKEKVFKTAGVTLKNKIVNDNSKRKIAPLKTEKLSTLEGATECKDSLDKVLPKKCVIENENIASLKPSWFTAQKDIMFEINERNRNLILREHAPSPGIGNKMSGFRLSSMQSQRPSLYQPMEIVADPHKEAMRAIEKACLSAKKKDIMFEINERNRNLILREHAPSPGIGNKMSGFRLSSMQSQRPSLYQPMEIVADPHKEAMRAIEKACLSAKRDRKNSKPEKLLKLMSPFKDRNSFYTPCTDPKQEVMESLRKLKLKQQQQILQKSTKKVTFNLNVIECTPKNNCDAAPELYQENKLSQINEKSEENTPNVADQDKANIELVDFKKTDVTSQSNGEIKETEVQDKCKEEGYCPPLEKLISGSVEDIKPDVLCEKVQCKEISSPLLLLHAGKMSTKRERTTYQEIFEQTVMNKENIQFSNQATVYTPRPISLYSQSKLKDSCSPEFLVKGTSELLLKEAPIRTPLVWKSVSKNAELSPDMEISLNPVRLKLDFTKKDTPKKDISKLYPLLNSKQIKTLQAKLDELADEECCMWLSSESIPVVCGRYITNPVADILDQGDETHFIPIKF